MDRQGGKVGELRIVLYLEDLGEAAEGAALVPATVTSRTLGREKENRDMNNGGASGGGGGEYSSAFELEVWKRAEQQKHKAYLK